MERSFTHKFKIFLMNPWTIAIAAPLIVIIIISVINSFKDSINILYSLIKIFSVILTYEIPIWKIFIFVVGLYFFLLIYKRIQKPEWTKYTQDKYKGYKFRWQYELVDGKFKVSTIEPVCENCSCPLSRKEYPILADYFSGEEDYMYCPKCSKKYNYLDYDIIEDFERVINQNIDSGEYKEKKGNN